MTYLPLHFAPCELLPGLPSISGSLPAALAIGLLYKAGH